MKLCHISGGCFTTPATILVPTYTRHIQINVIGTYNAALADQNVKRDVFNFKQQTPGEFVFIDPRKDAGLDYQPRPESSERITKYLNENKE